MARHPDGRGPGRQRVRALPRESSIHRQVLPLELVESAPGPGRVAAQAIVTLVPLVFDRPAGRALPAARIDAERFVEEKVLRVNLRTVASGDRCRQTGREE